MKISEIIKNDRLAISAVTEKMAITIIKEFEKHGVVWNFDGPKTGLAESNNKWHVLKERTCYSPGTGLMNSVEFYLEHDYKVISYEDVEFDDNSKSEKVVKQLKASSPVIIKEAKKQFVKEAKRAKKNLDKMSEFANTLNTQIARLQLKLNYLNDIVEGMGW